MQKRVAWKQRAGAAGRNHVCPFHFTIITRAQYGSREERHEDNRPQAAAAKRNHTFAATCTK